MSCYLDEFVSRVAKLLEGRASQKEIDCLLETLQPEYRDEVLAGAEEMLREHAKDIHGDPHRRPSVR